MTFDEAITIIGIIGVLMVKGHQIQKEEIEARLKGITYIILESLNVNTSL